MKNRPRAAARGRSVSCYVAPGRQDAAGDSLGLVSGDVSGDVPGAVDSSGLVGGDVTSGAVEDEAPGLLQPTMAPTRATASRMLLIMKISSD
jgi:hypothetical protein